MTLSTALGLIFIPVTFSVVEYLSHRFVRGGEGVTMDCGRDPVPKRKFRRLPDSIATEEGEI
jgi:HAE1 family hydrophobic/amphiphilic exporter-1